ncbi:unnamed protein product [Caenorhabditis angaria]|uniref:Tudor domain-containing protein n=1 Tax=Caenorhabditis angaria TaxID=860376 RepID=A0A9P1IMM8_9PELO|nr:unnamed protein product [Caenorhabditis angaria]
MELVEVEGGKEWRIRKLQEKYGNTCWKYACRDSPFNINIQPKYLNTARQNMTKQLNQIYNLSSENLENDQLFEGVACCVKFRNEWFRGSVEMLTKSELCYVKLVDFGDTKMVEKNNIRKLSPKFGRIPPMALNCTVKGVRIQEMDAYKIEEFQKILESLNYFARCQILSENQPFSINLFHPTMTGKNLCENIMAKRCLIEPPVTRKMKHEVVSEDEDYYDEEEEDEDAEVDETRIFIKEFPRANKAIRIISKNFIVCHVEHANLIYLTNEGMIKTRENIENYAKSNWNNLPRFPQKWFSIGNSCITQNYQRATIINKNENNQMADLFSIDHGVILKNVSMSEIRPAPFNDLFSLPPQIVAVSLFSPFRMHFDATRILRNILESGKNVEFQPYSKSKNIPTRGNLFEEKGKNIEEMFIENIKKSRIRLNCLEIAIYQPKYVKNCTNIDFLYNLEPPRCFTRSNLVSEKYPL